jgi:hypothetical protein
MIPVISSLPIVLPLEGRLQAAWGLKAGAGISINTSKTRCVCVL